MFTPAELAAEHARAMRIVKAILAACDARAATARAARDHNLKPGDAPWLLAIGKAAIGMAEGVADVCGTPEQHLIITVDGPPALSLPNILRSDHPLPTQRSLDTGQAVKRFIEEAKTAGASSLTVLISGGASSLICEPIPGIELREYRDFIHQRIRAGYSIQDLNAERRVIDTLKGGELAALASPMLIDLLVISDVIGDTLEDIGSGPFVQSPNDPASFDRRGDWSNIRFAVSFRPRLPRVEPPRRAIVVLNNQSAVHAAAAALKAEGFDIAQQRVVDELVYYDEDDDMANPASRQTAELAPRSGFVWGGEWPVYDRTSKGVGGRAQAISLSVLRELVTNREQIGNPAWCMLAFATDGTDGVAPPDAPVPAGAFTWSGMTGLQAETSRGLKRIRQLFSKTEPVRRWPLHDSYTFFTTRDAHRPAHEPPAHIFTGPTGTNVNDLLIAWRVR